MLKISLVASFIFICALTALSQKKTTILGDSWTGEVASVSENTREIIITYQGQSKTESFTGILEDSFKAKLIDDSIEVLKISDIPLGMRVRVIYKTKQEETGGRKVKVNRISYLVFLGRDEFARLRERLSLAESANVTLAETGDLPRTSPLKIYLLIESPQLKDNFIRWVGEWNKDEAKKYGSIELVSDLAQADTSLVIYRGSNALVEPLPIFANDATYNLSTATAFLVVQKDGGLEVLWNDKLLLVSPDNSSASKGRVEKETEKRMKSRSKAQKN